MWFTAALTIADIYWFTPCHHLHVLILPFFISFFFSCHGSCTDPVQPVLALTCNSFHTLARRNRLNVAYITRQDTTPCFSLRTALHNEPWMNICRCWRDLPWLLPGCVFVSRRASQLGDGLSPPVPAEVFQKYPTLNISLPYRSPPCRLRMMLTPEEQVVSQLKEQCVKIDHPYHPNPYNCYD